MSKVIANGLVVAHSNSGHIAHVLPPGDIRLVPPVPTPTPLWNQVASSKVFLNYPIKTKFESGLIWVDGTKVGPLSDPADTFPTPKGAVNSYACGQGSSGSQNVVVESKKVFRFTDMTWQNQYNSPGIINDAAGAARAKAEFDEAQKKNAPVVDADKGSGSGGAADGETGKEDEAGETETKPAETPAPETCEVAEVTLQDQLNKVTRTVTLLSNKGFFTYKKKKYRAPSPGEGAADESTIQVVDGSSVKLKAKLGTTLCGADKTNHAAAHWKLPDGSTKAGAEITWTANRTGSPNPSGTMTNPSGFMGWLAGAGQQDGNSVRDMLRLGDAVPVDNKIVCACCKGTKTRHIQTFPKTKLTQQIDIKPPVTLGTEFKHKVGGPLALTGKVEAKGFALKGEAAWEEEDDHTCTFGMTVTGECTILTVALRLRVSFFAIPWPIPIIGQIVKVIDALNWVCDKLFGRELITSYFDVRMEGTVTASIGVACKKAYREAMKFDALKGGVEGKMTITLALGISSLEQTGGGNALARAEASTSVVGALSGEVSFGAGKFGLKSAFTFGPITLSLELSWDLMILIPQGSDDDEAGSRWYQRLYNGVTSAARKGFIATAEGTLRSLTGYGLKGKKTWSVDAMRARVFELAYISIE